jgi:large subunit ribosomal protein L27
MAHRAGKKTARINRGSRSKRLGVKLYDGQKAKAGNIIIRQRGTKFLPGENVRKGKDDTLFATKTGKVVFESKNKTRYDGSKKVRKVVHVK